MTIDPQTQFPEFYGNRVALALASAKRWTVSGKLNEDSKGKAPIDVRHLIDTNGRVRGAWATDSQCLVDLPELTRRLPNAANAAFYLQASTDGLVVIDIEPGCPREIAQNLLALAGAVYTETSMSGKGYHLVTPLPANFGQFENARGKRVLREEHGWYEILIEHWVTFTRRPIEHRVLAEAGAMDLTQAEFASFEDVYASLAKVAKPSRSVSMGDVVEEQPKILAMGRVIRQSLANAESRLKDPDAFGNDMSRYEFSVLGVLYRQIHFQAGLVEGERQIKYSLSDRAWLLYLAAKEVLPPRDKHREQRNGRPFLLDRAAAMVALSNDENHQPRSH